MGRPTVAFPVRRSGGQGAERERPDQPERSSDALLKKVMKYFVEAGEQRDVITDSILDWRDADDFHRVNGAERTITNPSEPYDCKNAMFDTIEELLLVRGSHRSCSSDDGEKGQMEGRPGEPRRRVQGRLHVFPRPRTST